MNRRQVASLVALLGCFVTAAPAARSESLNVAVQNDGKPVSDAVVYALPLDGNGKPVPLSAPVVIDQVDKEYVPYVTAVRVGTAVNFPNQDPVRHHVYSFSEAKKFEIPLYRGTPADPIVFDTPGRVALGCNIHDWMKAYVFVSETPYFSVTGGDGTAIVDLPSGDYAVQVWHPELKGEPEATKQRISVNGAGASVDFAIEQKRVWRPRRAPDGGGGRYR